MEFIRLSLQHSIGLLDFGDVVLKGSLILLLTGLFTFVLKPASAATRHIIWFFSLMSLILLPLLALLLPEWRMPILPRSMSYSVPLLQNVEPGTPTLHQAETAIAPAATSSTPSPTPVPTRSQPSFTVTTSPTPVLQHFRMNWLLLGWLTGPAVLLIPVLLGTFTVWRMNRLATAVTEEPLNDLFEESCADLELKQPVRLLQSPHVTMPVTWGFRHHVILLPGNFADWSAERQRLVLLHELAHIKRRDCLTQIISWLVCSLFWFNPLVWLAMQRMRVERERACDDLVLTSGCKASDYASHLLEIARSFRRSVPLSITAVAMAKPAQLEGRLLAILDSRRNRHALSPAKATCILLALTAMILPLATLKATARLANRRNNIPSSTQPLFAPKLDFNADRGADEVAYADLDGDGQVDLVVMNHLADSVSIFRNTTLPGSGLIQFADKVDLPTGPNPLGVAVCDVDGDGKPDVLVSNHYGDFISVYRNVSQRSIIDVTSFEPPVLLITKRGPQTIALRDLNGDGRPDLVVANNGHGSGDTISIFENTSNPGKVSFADRIDLVTGAQPVAVAIEDIDGDGRLDIVVVNHLSGTLSVLPNLNHGGPITHASFSQKVDFPSGIQPYKLALADFDGDGRCDIALSHITATPDSPTMISFFKNVSLPGHFALAPRTDIPTGFGGAIGLVAGDLNGDGWPDLIVGHHLGDTISILLNHGQTGKLNAASFAPAMEIQTGEGASNPQIIDLDGDLQPDVVVPNEKAANFSILRKQ